MKIISKQVRLENQEYYKIHLNIINAFLPIKLTQRELEVLSLFMSFRGDLAEQRFGSTAKSIVRKKLNISSPNLSNYLKSLIDKGFIVKKTVNEYDILPILQPENTEQMYNFKLINIG